MMWRTRRKGRRRARERAEESEREKGKREREKEKGRDMHSKTKGGKDREINGKKKRGRDGEREKVRGSESLSLSFLRNTIESHVIECMFDSVCISYHYVCVKYALAMCVCVQECDRSQDSTLSRIRTGGEAQHEGVAKFLS